MPETTTQDSFWDARPDLARIRDYARASRVSPWSTFGVTLARLMASVPPRVQLPDHGSLNLYIALVGGPGAGKGKSVTASCDLLPLDVIPMPVGSGEGISHMFASRKRGEVMKRTRDAVLIEAGEIDTVAALNSRQAATLLPELRKAWMGETLGFSNADDTRSLAIERDTYRLCLIAGVQPARASVLLEDEAGGTPQRFLWLPATDPDAPADRPAYPMPLDWSPIAWEVPDGYDAQSVVMKVCQKALDDIDAARLPDLMGQSRGLDSHAPLARLKVAAALALLDCRDFVSEDDWGLAAHVMVVSNATRSRISSAVAESRQRENRSRGEAEAERAVIVADRTDHAAEMRAAEAIYRKLAKQKRPMTKRDLQQTLGRAKSLFDSAVLLLEDEQRVVRRTDDGTDVWEVSR